MGCINFSKDELKMKHVFLASLVVILGLLASCASVTCSNDRGGQTQKNIGRYQIAGDGNGHFMKIDTQTGKAWSTGGATWADWYKVPDSPDSRPWE
jgi:hypothetical protein